MMDGCMDGWIDDGWMYGWIDGWMDHDVLVLVDLINITWSVAL